MIMTQSITKKVTPVSKGDSKPKSKIYDFLNTNGKEMHSNDPEQEKNLTTSNGKNYEELAVWLTAQLTPSSISSLTQTNQNNAGDNEKNESVNEINKFVQYIITHPKEVQTMLDTLPQSIKDKISQHDSTINSIKDV